MADELNPVEELVLYRDDGNVGRRAAEAAVMLLIVRGALLPSRGTRRWSQPQLQLTAQADAIELPRYLAVVLDALRDRKKPEAPFGSAHLVQRLQRAFGVGFGGYVKREIWPDLIRRGYAIESEKRVLGVFRRRARELTDVGRGAHERLRIHYAPARELPKLMKKSPGLTAETLQRLGPVALLLPETRPYAKKLIKVLRDQRPSDQALALLDDNRQMGGHFDMLHDMDWSGMFDALDAAIDAGSSGDGGSDGGGDGGGGDGGT